MQFGAKFVRIGQCHGRCTFFGRVGAADVKTNIYRIRFNPQRMSQIQRHKHQLAAKYRCEVHAFSNVLGYRLVKTAFKTWRQCT